MSAVEGRTEVRIAGPDFRLGPRLCKNVFPPPKTARNRGRSASTRRSEDIFALSSPESTRAQARATLSDLNGHTMRITARTLHARIDGRDGLVVDAHSLQVFVGQVGDHDVGQGQQLFYDLAAGRLHRVQRQAELVAPHLEKHGAFATVGHRGEPTILAALDLLDADHLGTEVSQHRAAERTSDVAAEIENANS